MNVLSLCDGMSCGQIALAELGVTVNKYFASEIDENAIKVTMDNFPNTIQIGDMKKISSENIRDMPKIDLIMCGFPCRDLSVCTRQGGSKNWENMHKTGEGLQGKHSGLYWNFLRILECIRKYNNENVEFLVENVASMKENECIQISNDLNVRAIKIDSGLFSAQNRERLYWFNWGYSNPVEVCTDVLKDILDKNVKQKYFMDKEIENFNPENKIVGKMVFDFKAHDIVRRVHNINFKSPTLTSCRGGNLQKKIYIDGRYRKLTPNEYRKLQTIPEWYKMNVADSHIYNMCGDGWTIEVIKYILSVLLIEKRKEKKWI